MPALTTRAATAAEAVNMPNWIQAFDTCTETHP
jgi:hypothetical protein